MVEQQHEAPPLPEEGELLAGAPPPGSQQLAPTPEEIMEGASKFLVPPEVTTGAPPPQTAAEQADTTQVIRAYTAAEVQAAAEEMKKLPPQTFIAMKERIRELQDQEQDGFPEAGGVVWTTLYAESGAEFSVTERSVNSQVALDRLVRTIIHAGSKYKLTPARKSDGGDAQVTTSPAGIETGTNKINWISVERNENDSSKLVVKFSVGKFKYPFQEHRGAAKALSLFDSALCEPRIQGGWTEAHFATPGARYEINGTLSAKWEHRGKYYNVLEVVVS